MSRPVDVLEVMRRSANAARMTARKHGGQVLTQFAEYSDEARAAVAELIEASSRVASHGTRSARQINADWDRLRSAVARVRGAA